MPTRRNASCCALRIPRSMQTILMQFTMQQDNHSKPMAWKQRENATSFAQNTCLKLHHEIEANKHCESTTLLIILARQQLRFQVFINLFISCTQASAEESEAKIIVLTASCALSSASFAKQFFLL